MKKSNENIAYFEIDFSSIELYALIILIWHDFTATSLQLTQSPVWLFYAKAGSSLKLRFHAIHWNFTREFEWIEFSE